MSERYRLRQNVWHTPSRAEQENAALRCDQQAVLDAARWAARRDQAGALRDLVLVEIGSDHAPEQRAAIPARAGALRHLLLTETAARQETRRGGSR